MTVPVIDIHEGTTPLIINVPHDGREIPSDLGAVMTSEALALPDTDWHMRDLYGFARELGATITSARYSRYVVDLNRDPTGKSLYPGADTTEVCPLATFDREAVYEDGASPDKAEVERRLAIYWRPFHAELRRVIEATLSEHGVVLLFDAHSIRSRLPRFFEGDLPDFNFGTADGKSCEPELSRRMFNVLSNAKGFSAVLNGRFKGGYITRHYGNPERRVHAVQLEMSQRVYMEESPPWRLVPERSARLTPILRHLLVTGLEYVCNGSR